MLPDIEPTLHFFFFFFSCLLYRGFRYFLSRAITYTKDIKRSWRGSAKATKLVFGMASLHYEETLKRLGLMRLDTRRG